MMILPILSLDATSAPAGDFVLPDTSGLEPLKLPVEISSQMQHPQNAPSEDSVSRFQAAMETSDKAIAGKSLPPDAGRRFFANSLVVAAQHVADAPLEAPAESVPVMETPAAGFDVVAEEPKAVASDKPAVADRPVASTDRPIVVESHAPAAARNVAVDSPMAAATPVQDESVERKAVQGPVVAKAEVDAEDVQVVPGRQTASVEPAAVVDGRPVAADKPVSAARPLTVARPEAVAEQPMAPVQAVAPKAVGQVAEEAMAAVAKPAVVVEAGRAFPAAAVSVVPEATVSVVPKAVVSSAERPVAVVETSMAADKVVPTADKAMPTADKAMPTADKVVPAADKPVVVAEPDRKTKDVSVAHDEPVVVIAPVPVAIDATPAPSGISAGVDVAAASARTVEIAATVEEVVAAVSEQIVVTPSLVKGEGEVAIRLKPTVLDGSEMKLSVKDNSFSVVIVPTTAEVAQVATAAAPQLERALAEHMPTFGHVAVAVAVAVAKKGKLDEGK